MNEATRCNTGVKLGMIYAGGCGVNIGQQVASYLDPEEHSYLGKMFINTDGPQLNYMLKEKARDDERLYKWTEAPADRFMILPIGKTQMGAGGVPEVAREAAEEKIEIIQEFMDSFDFIICLGGGGGGTGSGVLPVLAQAASKSKKSALITLTMPLADEGKARMVIAQEALKAIRKKCPAIVIHNEQIPNKNQSVKAAWREINQSCIIQMMLVLQEIIQVVGDVMNLDMNDLKQMLSAGNRVQFGYSLHEDNDDAEAVAKTLLSNPYQDTSIALAAKKFSMWRHGDWNINTFSRMTQEINRMRGKDDGGIDIKCGMVSDIQDRKKWVALLAVAEDVPDEDIEDSTAHAAMMGKEKASLIPTNGKGELVQIQCLVANKVVHLDVPRDIRRRWDKVCALMPSQENCGEVEKLIDEIVTLTNVRPDIPIGFERISR